jgi:hypothetical protein
MKVIGGFIEQAGRGQSRACRCEPAASAADPRERPARRPLPARLPRATVTHGTATTCPGCGGALHLLGKNVTEVLDYIPASRSRCSRPRAARR